VAQLMDEYWPEPVDEDLILRSWTSPRVAREHDARLGDDSYALVEGLDDGRVWIEIHGRPTAVLVDWAEARAREKGRRLLTGGWSANEPLLRELERRDFRLVRHSHRMDIELSQPTPAPRWPADVDTRTFVPGDERIFYELHQETFRDSWEHVELPYDEWKHWLLEPPMFVPDLWFLALASEEAAGFAICHPHPGNPELGWVGELGVRRSSRRLGLGRALLLHAFSEFRRRGFKRAGLGVDAESLTGAHKLYESAGMRVAARFDVYEKELP
jgi:ribosomal protein S18 acetylase RimI-like enzyme